MANEITITGGLTFAKGKSKATISGNDKADMTGDHYIQRVDTIGTDEEAVSKGDIATLGYCAFRNAGTSGVIRVGGVTGNYVLSLQPGQFGGPMKWATNAIFAISDTANSELEMLLIEA